MASFCRANFFNQRCTSANHEKVIRHRIASDVEISLLLEEARSTIEDSELLLIRVTEPTQLFFDIEESRHMNISDKILSCKLLSFPVDFLRNFGTDKTFGSYTTLWRLSILIVVDRTN